MNRIRKVVVFCVCMLFIVTFIGIYLNRDNTITYQKPDPSKGKAAINPVSPSNGIRFNTHVATQTDIDDMKLKLGIRDPNKNYNIIISGHGTGLAPPSIDDYEKMIGTIRITDGVDGYPTLPSSIDHSLEPCFPAVGDQQMLGSCASWATAYYANGYQQAHDLNWTLAGSGNESQLMSPRWAYNHVNDGQDRGAHTWQNGDLMKSVGCARMSTFPYDGADYTSWGPEEAWRDAPEYRCDIVNFIRTTDDAAVTTVKNLLFTNHTMPFAFDAGTYSSGLGSGDDTITSSEMRSSMNHANCIVGYDDVKSSGGETGAFKCVNSWGASWGSAWGGNGFYWMTYEAFKKLGTMYPVIWFDDKQKYEPSLLGVWHFSPAGKRDASVELGIGPQSSPVEVRVPEWMGGASENFPDFMCMDITEFKDNWGPGTRSFYLELGGGGSVSTVSSFKIELYQGDYIPGSPVAYSDESPDVPKANPCVVTVSFGEDYNLTLASGWNLVSFPVLGVSLNASGLGLANGENISMLDTLAQNYYEFIQGTSPPSSDFMLMTGLGYWIRADAAKEITLSGIKPLSTMPQTLSISVPSSGGWVLVGWTSMNNTRHASDLASYITGANVKIISKWDRAGQLYQDYVVGVDPASEDFTLIPGEGYMVWVDNPCTLMYNP